MPPGLRVAQTIAPGTGACPDSEDPVAGLVITVDEDKYQSRGPQPPGAVSGAGGVTESCSGSKVGNGGSGAVLFRCGPAVGQQGRGGGAGANGHGGGRSVRPAG